MLALNLGCGYRTSERCVNIDWSPPVRLRSTVAGRLIAPMILNGDRRDAYESMVGELRSHDLRKGIPFEDGAADAVYHSHLLEHIDRDAVPGFFAEVLRVLRPGGIHRIAVPDLERQARAYLTSVDAAIAGRVPAADHERTIHELIEQMVRREAHSTSTRKPARRWLENRLLGDARKRGETHQWMWDRVSLPHALTQAGFTDVRITSNTESRIPEWREYKLDENGDGEEYKPDSFYVEAVAP